MSQPSDWSKTVSVAVAAARCGVGVFGLAAPGLLVKAWTGADADSPTARVLGRSMAGRDLALGIGTLKALRAGNPIGWIMAGVLADTSDALATLAAYAELPKLRREATLLSAAGAVAAGVAAARVMRGSPAA